MEIQNLRKSSIYNHDKKNDQFQHVRFHGLIVQVLFGIDTFTVQLNTKHTEIRYIQYNHDKKMINFKMYTGSYSAGIVWY